MKIKKPEWYSSPKQIAVSIDVSRVKKNLIGNEVIVFARIGENDRNALVPNEAFNQEKGVVYAAEVGEMGDSVLLSFPASSTGTAIWAVPKALKDKFITYSEL